MAKLKEVCVFYSGTGFPIKYQGNEKGEYAFYKVGDIANNVQLGNTFLSICNNYISCEVAKEIKGCILPKDTVVFAKIGEAVKLNRRAITGADCLIDNNAMGLAPIQEKLRLNYFFYYMRNLKMEKLAESTTVPSVRKSLLEELEIKVPSLEKQKEIGEILDKISAVIQNRKQQLEKLDLLIKARFVEMFGDLQINDKNWKTALIGDNCFVTKLAGFEYTNYIHYEDSGDVVMVKAQNVKNGKLNRKELSFISKEVSDSLPRSQLAPGDVVMTYVGANIGDVALIDDEYKYHLAPNVAKISPDKEKYNSNFFLHMLAMLRRYIAGNSADTAKAALGMERIRNLSVFIPPIDKQNEFTDFVQQLDKSKFEYVKYNIMKGYLMEKDNELQLTITNKYTISVITEIKALLDASRKNVAANVNKELLLTYWKIGEIIVHYEQNNQIRAEYGEKTLQQLSKSLSKEFGKGFSRSNIYNMRQFYLSYPIFQTVSGKLSWSHYGELLSISDIDKRNFYEKECIASGWSVRELKRQKESSLFERLLLSKGEANKKQILSMAAKGVNYSKAEDIIRDPYVFEFLGIPENKSLLENDLETALVRQIENFLLEIGRSFMFVGTQQRVPVGNTMRYVDMVFYNKILRAYVLIKLKAKEFSPEAAGQLNMYLNYYAAEVNDADDNPPIGIIMCTDKNSVDVEYALGGLSNQIFASKYVLYMPDKEQLIDQVERVLECWHSDEE